MKYLSPLLLAYEDRMSKKDTLLRTTEVKCVRDCVYVDDHSVIWNFILCGPCFRHETQVLPWIHAIHWDLGPWWSKRQTCAWFWTLVDELCHSSIMTRFAQQLKGYDEKQKNDHSPHWPHVGILVKQASESTPWLLKWTPGRFTCMLVRCSSTLMEEMKIHLQELLHKANSPGWISLTLVRQIDFVMTGSITRTMNGYLMMTYKPWWICCLNT